MGTMTTKCVENVINVIGMKWYYGVGMVVKNLVLQMQGLLDWKFLNDRFQRGKVKVTEVMDRKHRLLCVDSLFLAHSSIVQMQQELGNSTFLG